ncbi:MAG: hypothetical protein U0324_45815 [Polyangiales bacterium]
MSGKKAPWAASTQVAQPEGKIRRSQLITAYGPGAMVDLVEDAVVVGGLDFWEGDGMHVLREPRLCASINARRRQHGLKEIRSDDPFREPPMGDDQQPRRGSGIRAVEFPRWFVCQNPGCRALTRAQDGLERKGGRYLHRCDDRKTGAICVPVRFVAACPRGHLEDFPWVWFAHVGASTAATTPSWCSTRARRATSARSGCAAAPARRVGSCRRPARTCPRATASAPGSATRARRRAAPEEMKLLVRTASGAYFALVESALSIPPLKELALRDAIDGVWNVLQVAPRRSRRSV